MDPSQSPRAAVAERLQSAAVHLLRRVRETDAGTTLSPARLSALSVLSQGGPRALGELAAAEHVKPPTMTAIVRALQAEGLVTRTPSKKDRRVVIIKITRKGQSRLRAARRRRNAALEELLAGLGMRDVSTLGRAADLMERIVARE